MKICIINDVKIPKCECGGELEIDKEIILPSYPPQYRTSCKRCGNISSIRCEDVGEKMETIEFEELMKLISNELVVGGLKLK